MKFWKLASAATALVLSTSVYAALIVDQKSTYELSGGVRTAVQSFMPEADNIAGIDAYLYNVASYIDGSSEINYTANVTLNLYSATDPEDFSYVNNEVLASASFFLDAATSGTGWAELRWDAIQVIPDTYYIMELVTDNGYFGLGTDTYDRGQRLEGFFERDYFDLNFRTYSDDTFVSAVPVPAAVWLFGSGLIGWVGFARHTKA